MAVHHEAIAGVETAAVPSNDEAGEAPRTRLCGRCRKPSAWNPDDPPTAAAVWFLCPPCREALIGGVGRGRQS
jgi:hypothetical protein